MVKRLYRSKNDKIIAGVCGGIAEHFAIDPVWVRLVAVLLVFADGIGILLYIIGWILIPPNPNQKDTKKTKVEEAVEKVGAKAQKSEKKVDKKDSETATMVLGAIILVVGLGLLFQNFFPWFSFEVMWPAALIALGLFLLMRKK